MEHSKIKYYVFNNFCLDTVHRKLLKDGEPISITNKAFQTLHILVRNSGEVVQKETLFAELWADSFVEESNLTQYIHVLRKILGKDSEGNSYIRTITKNGYLFTIPVKEATSNANIFNAPRKLNKVSEYNLDNNSKETEAKSIDADAVTALKSEEINPSLKLEEIFPEATKKNSKTKFYYLLLVLIPALLIILLFYISGNRNSGNLPENSAAALKTGRSVAILPFKPVDDESKNNKLGFGMADAIITRLSKLHKIPVRPTSAIFQYTDNPAPDPQIVGRELGVDSVLEGTVQKNGNGIRVTVQLINVNDKSPIWAESYDETFEDVFSVQNLIANKIAQSMELNVSREQEHILAQRATKNIQAFQQYQLGVYLLNKRAKVDLQEAAGKFQSAIELDPEYAQAYAGLADTYNMLDFYHFADSKEMREKSQAAAGKALSLDNSLAEAHMAAAYFQDDPNVAEESLKTAIDLSPYNSTIRIRYAWILLKFGNLEEAVSQAKLGREYDPLSNVANNVVCGFLSFQYKFKEAIPYCEKSLAIAPNAPRSRLILAKNYFFDGRNQEAVDLLKTQINLSSGVDKDEALGLLCYFYAKQNRRPEAENLLAEIKSKVNENPILYNCLTLDSYALGRKEEALNYFKKAIDLDNSWADLLRFRYDPLWEDVRNDKQFTLRRK